jgi:uncharacterized protein YpmS
MSRKGRRIAVIGLAAILILIALAIWGVYLAIRHEPAFYREAMETRSDVLEKASDRMLKKIGALQSVRNRSGRWQEVITAEEINGWLAVDLRKNHPNALPPSVSNPRVAIEPNEMTVACRFERGGVTSVLSLTFQPYLPEPSVVALRIVRGRAGMLPVPLKDVLDGISKGAAELHLRLRWAHAGNDPVALISLPDDDDADRVVRIESLELRKGEICVSGITERRKR